MRSIVSIRHSVHTARTVVLTMIQDLPLTICARLFFFCRICTHLIGTMSSFWIIQDCVVDSFRVRACVQRSKNLIVLFIGTFFSSAGFLVWARVRSNIQYVFIYIFKKKRKEKLCILFLFSAVDKWIDSEIQITTKQRTRNCVSCVQAFINKCVACIDIRYMSSDRLIYKCN